MVFPNLLELAFIPKMMFHDWIVEVKIILHFLYLLQLFSLNHNLEDLKSSGSLDHY
ncbi:hypothetical protein Lser_V15G04110 [Lactuca serriola]